MAEETKAKKADKKSKSDEQAKDENFRYIVRILNTDVDGNKNIILGLQSVKGVGARVARIAAKRTGIPTDEIFGNLSEEQTTEIENILNSYIEFAPAWAINRQCDIETGEDMHLYGQNLDLTNKDDINRLKKIKCYRGRRHEQGQKVRGQRTRSNGRTGLTMGVSRTKNQPGSK